MKFGFVCSSDRVPFQTTRVTVYEPGLMYVFVGFWLRDFVPSPKFQIQRFGIPSDVSVNLTFSGDFPVTGFAVNDAIRVGVGVGVGSGTGFVYAFRHALLFENRDVIS